MIKRFGSKWIYFALIANILENYNYNELLCLLNDFSKVNDVDLNLFTIIAVGSLNKQQDEVCAV